MADTITTTDAGGRVLVLRVLDPADMLDLLEAAGEASANVGFMRYAMVICSVAMIGDVPVPLPGKREEMKAVARRLGNDGFAAVSKAMFGADEGKPGESKPDGVIETAKN